MNRSTLGRAERARHSFSFLLSVLPRLQAVLHAEATPGVLLMLAAALALGWANSPLAAGYHALWHAPVTLGLGPWQARVPLHFVVNDGLMAVFFLVVGMEVRREMHDGALARWRLAALPLAAALGGVAVPAALYLALLALSGHGALAGGWAVPTATDIAFALGVLALLGRRVPPALRVLLLALAVIDDLVAVLVIALFYGQGLAPGGLALAAGALGLVWAQQRLGVASAWAYVPAGLLLWGGLLLAGAHPTLAGVVLGLMTPVHLPKAPPALAAPLRRVPAALHPWVAFGAMPLFALANAGVDLGAIGSAHGPAMALAVAIAVALVAGKLAGVLGACWLAMRGLGCRLPEGVDWRALVLLGLLAGIGFTMSIFIATLAFEAPALQGAAKLGVLGGSALAAVLAWGWGRFALRTRPC